MLNPHDVYYFKKHKPESGVEKIPLTPSWEGEIFKDKPSIQRQLMPLLTGSEEYKARDFVIGQYYSKQSSVNLIRMIRTHEFKLNRHIRYGDELYDLKKDPDEMINIANDPQYTEIKEQLSQKLNEWIEKNENAFYSQKATNRSGEVFDN